jgi:hypothetical protein
MPCHCYFHPVCDFGLHSGLDNDSVAEGFDLWSSSISHVFSEDQNGDLWASMMLCERCGGPELNLLDLPDEQAVMRTINRCNSGINEIGPLNSLSN